MEYKGGHSPKGFHAICPGEYSVKIIKFGRHACNKGVRKGEEISVSEVIGALGNIGGGVPGV